MRFSVRARRLVDTAVSELPDQARRDIWRAWAAAHPELRQAGDSYDIGDPVPQDVASVAVLALAKLFTKKRRQRDALGTSEDEASIIDNDLSTRVVLAVVMLLILIAYLLQAVIVFWCRLVVAAVIALLVIRVALALA